MESQEAKETKSIITGIITSTPLRLTVNQLCNDFQNIVGYKIPIRKLGFTNVEEYLRSIPDTVKVCGSGNSAEVQGIVKEKSAHINLMVCKQRKDHIPAHKRRNVKSQRHMHMEKPRQENTYTINDDQSSFRIPKNIQNHLRKLIMQFPDGLDCTRLPLEYRKIFKEPLKYEKYGYVSLIALCTDLPEIFQYYQPNSDQFILYDRSKAIPSHNQNDLLFTKDVKHSASDEIDWSLGPSLIPGDIVNFLDEIQRYSLNDLAIGDFLDVKIGEIYNINKFFVIPKYGALDELMEELQLYMDSNRNRYIIPSLFFEIGLYCTVYYKNKYHRAVITELLANSTDIIEVLFIDYGSVGKVDKREVWYLPDLFSTVPCQAIKAGLANVVYASGSTEAQTLKKFRDTISNTILLAEIMNINREGGTIQIYLANITDENNIYYINDSLVEKGYAKYF